MNWGEGESDFTGCGSCKLSHKYNTAAFFTVTAPLDDLSGTMVTRRFTLDSRVQEPATVPAAGPGTTTFLYTGSMQAFTVPQGVTVLHVQAWGASGGTAPNNGICTIGGLGGYAFGDLAVSSGVTVWVSVGGEGVPGGTGGWNGGGDACNNTLTCASGGGASDIRFGGQTLNDRVLVGAGGGGAEYSGCAGTGGNGGGLIGDAGSESYPHNGAGGTQSEGGSPTGGTHLGTSGMFGIGGTSGNHPEGHSAGGGGGWWGGAGSAEDGHGGGGSSYYGGMSGSRGTTAGVQSGNGRIVITW